MKFFIDTADVEEIKQANLRGWVDGVTTNPTLIAKTGKPMNEVIANICEIVNGSVSAEVLSTDAEGMYKEGLQLAKISDKVTVKIPMCEDGLIAVRRLAAERIPSNVTLVFSPIQALMVAKAGAVMCSPFVGRLDDISTPGMELISQIHTIYQNYGFSTEILVASVRHPIHVLESALIGADIVTVPYSVMKTLGTHPLTDKGIAKFLEDAKTIKK